MIKIEGISPEVGRQSVSSSNSASSSRPTSSSSTASGKKWCCVISAVLFFLGLLVVAAVFIFGYFTFQREKTDVLQIIDEQAQKLDEQNKLAEAQAEKDKIVGGSEIWREDLATAEYQVTASYVYTNDGPGNINKVEWTMALIPDIHGYQDVISENISPADYEIITDADGNRFAQGTIEATLPPGGKYEFKETFRVKVDTFSNHLGSCTGEKLKNNLQAETYLESDNASILQLAQQITVDKTDDCQMAEAIYDYVGDNLQYQKDDRSRQGGALQAYEEKKGDCTYFADLFIALARAAGIPSRFLEGVTYNKEKKDQAATEDIKHDWAEVYLPGTGWTPVDPTWGREESTRPYYFSQGDGQHLVVARGRNLPELNNGHYFYYYYWYDSGTTPQVHFDENWQVKLVE